MDVGLSTVEQAADALRAGRPAIFPTDTVLGLGVSVRHAQTPAVLYDLKHRDGGKPVAWLVGSPDDILVYGKDVPAYAAAAARAFWPGALTLIVKASDQVPLAFRSEAGTIGLRMPDSACALELLGLVGCPIATTSANMSGAPSAGAIVDLDEDLARRVGVVLVGKAEPSGVASTVVDCTGASPAVVRQGAVTLSALESLA